MSSDEATVEERLQRLEDRQEIRGLIQAYRRHLDARDLRGYSELFADDGEWHGRTGYGKGPEGIRQMLEELLPANPPAPGPTSFHVVTEPVIELNGDRATGTMTWALVERDEHDVPQVRLLGHYDDVYVRQHGRWKFGRRLAQLDIPFHDLGTSS
jgi:uncharacterized protein (TIGR02246 family)